MQLRLFINMLNLSLVLIGLNLIGIKGNAQQPLIKEPGLEIYESLSTTEDLEETIKKKPPPLVEVEPTNILPGNIASSSTLVPYQARRKDWGIHAGVTYSMFTPIGYESRFISPTLGDFDTIFGGAQTPLIEFHFDVKYNFFLGSLALDTAVGTYSNASANNVTESTLNLTMFSLGAKYTMDNLFYEPWVAPFVSVGGYIVQYSEVQGASTFDGNTSVAPYFSIGGLFQLDWVDSRSALESYLESGIENTFIVVEGRQFLEAGDPQDPDFGTDFHVNAGLIVEF